MCDPISSIFFHVFRFFVFKKINHWYRFQSFREMRQKLKKVGRETHFGDNSEANATNRVFIVQIVTSQKGHKVKNSFLGKKGRKMDPIKKYIYIYFLFLLNKTEKSISS